MESFGIGARGYGVVVYVNGSPVGQGRLQRDLVVTNGNYERGKYDAIEAVRFGGSLGYLLHYVRRVVSATTIDICLRGTKDCVRSHHVSGFYAIKCISCGVVVYCLAIFRGSDPSLGVVFPCGATIFCGYSFRRFVLLLVMCTSLKGKELGHGTYDVGGYVKIVLRR